MNTKKITLIALLVSLAMICSFIESLIPPLISIPGVKIGLPNLIVVFALYKLDFKSAVLVSLVRVFLSSLLFGTVLTLAYSLSGAVLSLLLMFIVKKIGFLSEIGVSVIGGVSHNIAQIVVASLLLETQSIIYYLPVLLATGCITGAVIGIGGGLLIKRIRRDFK